LERWTTPTTQKDVEQFLGLAGYYRRFIADFSKIASPLSELCGTLKKSKAGAERRPPTKRFTWGRAQQQAFEQLKAAVSSAPCLAIPDPQREFIVHTDASSYATGAVLMQQFSEGLRPIAFLSKKMSAAERNYPVHEQELLAILNALKAWRHYLGGRRFTVLTDHQSLQYVETSAMATPRQMRWAAWLSEFDFSIRYGRGDANVAADALSRGAAGRPPTDSAARPVGELGQDTTPLRVTSLQEQGAHSERLLVFSINELAPLPVRVREVAAADSEYQALLRLSSDSLARQQLSRFRGLLYRKAGDGGDGGGQLVIPKNGSLRTWLLSSAHDTLLGAHHSGATTCAWLRERVWWSSMATDAERYVRGCESCQRNKPDLRGRQGLPLSIETPSCAWEVICMDFIGPLPRTARGYDTILVVIEKLTRWVYYIPTHSTATAQDVFALVDRYVLANHDTPRQIISDRDSRFTSHFWEDLWAAMRTQLKRSTAFHPQTDGQTERANRTLIEQLRSHVDQHHADWDLLLPQLQRANNTAVCVTTGFSPFEMNYGRSMRTELDAELERDGAGRLRASYPGAAELAQRRETVEAQARERIAKAQAKQRQDASQGRRAPDIRVGDRVWLSNRNFRPEHGRARKLEPLYFGPYEVMEMHGSNAARLRMPDDCRLHPVFNLDLLRKFVDGRSEFPERPVRDYRPGPVPEEDAQAGGPGEPEYEVEAIIGSRGRGARMSYKVKWLGWPLEQASWRPAAECRQTCPQRVREFEEQQLRRLQAVQLLREVEVERRRKRVQWSSQGTHSGEIGMAESPSLLHCVSVPENLRIAALHQQQLSTSEDQKVRCDVSVWSHPRRPLLQRELHHHDGRMLRQSDTRAQSQITAPYDGESVPTPGRSQQLHSQLHQPRMLSQGGRQELDERTGRKDSMRSDSCMTSLKASTGDSEMRATGASMQQRCGAEMPWRSSVSEKQHAVAVACTRLRADRSWMNSVQEKDEHMQAVDVSSDPRALRSRQQHAASDGQGTRTSTASDEETSPAPLRDSRQGGSITDPAQKHEMTVSHPSAGSIAGSARSAAPPMESERPASCALSCRSARVCVADQSRGGQHVLGEQQTADDSSVVHGPGGVKSYPAAEPWKEEWSGGGWGERDAATLHGQGQSPQRSSSLLQDQHTCRLGHTCGTHSPEDSVSSGARAGQGGSLRSHASAAGQEAKEEPCGAPSVGLPLPPHSIPPPLPPHRVCQQSVAKGENRL
jgi:hypothetical protein